MIEADAYQIRGEQELEPARGLECPTCSSQRTPGSPHVRVGPAGIEVYCSAECLESRDRIPEVETAARAASVSPFGAIFFLGVGAASLSPCSAHYSAGEMHKVEPPARVATAEPEGFVDDTPVYGPHLPSDRDQAAAVAANLAADSWVHPLAGPMRRMPSRQSRAFGAARDGNRPFECRSGHCGVDLGGSIWGEPIHSVHRGVVDKVNHDPSRSGGKYIRIAHRDGTVFSQYFHLAAIPRRLRVGTEVETGQVIGLLGETGVQNSGPHLHFTISVQPSAESREFYIDPEPLVALWPVVVPRIGGTPSTELKPGIPVGATGRHGRHSRHKKARRRSRSTVPRESQLATAEPTEAVEAVETIETRPAETARAPEPDRVAEPEQATD